MSPDEITSFRLGVRLMMIEHLAIKTAFEGLVLNQGKSIEQAQMALKDWFDQNRQVIDRAYGEHFRDPGLTALYADEANDVIEKLKKIVDNFAADVKGQPRT